MCYCDEHHRILRPILTLDGLIGVAKYYDRPWLILFDEQVFGWKDMKVQS